jgi:uncharacterized membrane protein YeaQ/YmgE (transglycosylase-associated protein family)
MDLIASLILAVQVGWLATLIMDADIDRVSLLDFAIGVAGAGLVGGFLAPAFGIFATGPYGFSLAAAFVYWLGAVSLLAACNLVRYGKLRCGRRARPEPSPDSPENSAARPVPPGWQLARNWPQDLDPAGLHSDHSKPVSSVLHAPCQRSGGTLSA